jgi:hypothetical protein
MDLIMGENTIEGDTDNDAGAAGGINPEAGPRPLNIKARTC